MSNDFDFDFSIDDILTEFTESTAASQPDTEQSSEEREVEAVSAPDATTTYSPVEEEALSEPEINKSNKWHIIAGVIVLAVVCSIWNLFTGKDTTKVSEATKENVIPVVEKQTPKDENLKEETKEDEETAKEDETPKEEVKEETTDAEPAIDKTKVVLLFSGETWIEVKDKNKVYTQGVFHKGDKKELAYVKSLFITVGRPENIKVYVKGVEKNILAKNRKSNIPLDSLD